MSSDVLLRTDDANQFRKLPLIFRSNFSGSINRAVFADDKFKRKSCDLIQYRFNGFADIARMVEGHHHDTDKWIGHTRSAVVCGAQRRSKFPKQQRHEPSNAPRLI